MRPGTRASTSSRPREGRETPEHSAGHGRAGPYGPRNRGRERQQAQARAEDPQEEADERSKCGVGRSRAVGVGGSKIKCGWDGDDERAAKQERAPGVEAELLLVAAVRVGDEEDVGRLPRLLVITRLDTQPLLKCCSSALCPALAFTLCPVYI